MLRFLGGLAYLVVTSSVAIAMRFVRLLTSVTNNCTCQTAARVAWLRGDLALAFLEAILSFAAIFALYKKGNCSNCCSKWDPITLPIVLLVLLVVVALIDIVWTAYECVSGLEADALQASGLLFLYMVRGANGG